MIDGKNDTAQNIGRQGFNVNGPPTYPIGLYHNESTGVNASYFDGRAGFSAMNGGNQAQYYSAPGYGGYLNSFGFTRESWYNN